MESLLIYLFKSAGLISLFYIFYMLLLKNETSFTANRKFLLGGILTSIVLPFIYFTKKVFINTPEIVYSDTSQYSNFIVTTENTSPNLDWWMIAGIIYLITTGFFLLRFCIRLFQILKMIHFSKITKDGKFRIVETQDETGPFSFFNYLFINSSAIPEDEYLIMLRHEKIHANQIHSFDMLASHLFAAIIWFNPISWAYKKAVEQNLEFIADQETAQASESIQKYQHVLVKVTTNQYQNVLVNHFYQSFIKKRIVMLNKKNTSTRNSWKYQLVFPLLALFIMSFNVKTTTEYLDTNSTKTIEPIIQKESLSVTIVKTTTKESLEKFKSIFLKWHVELFFDNIKYSGNGKIIAAIEVKFKNLNSGETGVLIRNDSNGISPFEIYVNKNDKTGFRDITTEEYEHKNAALQLKEIGKNPLYILNNKEYLSSDLDGKTIKTTTLIEILKPKDARKRFGAKASDGAIIVAEGKIIDDFKEELKLIDKGNKKEAAYFIEVTKNELPVFISLSNNPKSINTTNIINYQESTTINPSNKNREVKPIGYGVRVQFTPEDKDSIVGNNEIMNVRTKNGNRITWVEKDSVTSGKGFQIADSLHVYRVDNLKDEAKNTFTTKNQKILIIIDGKPMPKDYDINQIAPDNIKSMNVIKGKAAAITYGDKAKDGVLEIFTKENQKDIIAFEGNTNNSEMYVISPNSKDLLIVVDGKIKDESFKMGSINNENIKSVNVLKGESATKKYGKKGEKGVVEIILKEKI